mmetsp:Transcript_17935/g.25116  ORF Transcript_17935/g.25116 Transcript_17935/m.25116 type:complete len:140 (+) Transcript_17935:261-680(+)
MTSENTDGAAKMAKRVKVEGKMTFFSDYDKELSKELKLTILDAGYKPENFKDRKMAQPGIFVFNEKKEMIFKYVKEGEGPWGRPLPGNLFSIIAAHVKAAGEGPISAIPNEKIKDLPVQDKKALEDLKAELEPKGLYPE